MYDDVFEVVTTSSGARSIRHKILNETMHNPVGPWLEAHGLYVIPSGLQERLRGGGALCSDQVPLVLFDVGLGAGTNAVAAIHCKLAMPPSLSDQGGRPLEVVSFERDLRLLAFALSHYQEFPYLEPYRDALEGILELGIWKSACGSVSWRLHHGDFVDTMALETSLPELIFYDPYSPKVNREMWTVDCFKSLYDRCKAGKSLLLTYSIATPIRVALLMAGFSVGHGPRSGLKHETTQAATDPDLLRDPLGQRWLQRWERSHTKYPFEATSEQYSQVMEAVYSHPQFLEWTAPKDQGAPLGS